MVVIAISFTLLALAAGMFLLAKAQKESLGMIFKLGSYLIILVSFLCLAGIGIRSMMCCSHNGGHNMMGFNQGQMSCCHGCMHESCCKDGDNDGSCSMHHGKSCCKEDKGSCSKDMKDMDDDDKGKADSTSKKK